jgi:hypothetical protein
MSGRGFSMEIEGFLSDQRLIEVASLADNLGWAEILDPRLLHINSLLASSQAMLNLASRVVS